MNDRQSHPTVLADWQLPEGVNRGLWDYIHDSAIAREYDAKLAGTPLFSIDRRFVEEFCPRPGRLLDLGCGTGRLLIPFAQRGYRVLGVDLSAEMLAVAGAKAAAAGVSVRVLRPGGRFLLHVHNRWFNCWNRAGRRWLAADALWARTGDRVMPVHQGIAGLTLHLFTRREAVRLLREAGFRLLEVRPISLREDGRLPVPAWFGWL